MRIRRFLLCALLYAVPAAKAHASMVAEPAWSSARPAGIEADAAFGLGRSYEGGRLQPRDMVRAVYWYGVAARMGHADAQYRLAVLFSAGHGVARDMPAALAWLRRAASGGNAEAQYRLGALYLRRAFETRYDPALGAAWVARSARQGFPEAQFALGMLYAEGRGVARNALAALQWIGAAARNGHAAAARALAHALAGEDAFRP